MFFLNWKPLAGYLRRRSKKKFGAPAAVFWWNFAGSVCVPVGNVLSATDEVVIISDSGMDLSSFLN